MKHVLREAAPSYAIKQTRQRIISMLKMHLRSRMWVKLYLSPRDYKQCNGPVAFEQYYSTTCEGKESTGPARWCLGDSHRPTRLRWTLRARLGQHDRSRTPPKGACRNTRGTCGRWAVGMSISVRMSIDCLSNWDRFSGLERLQRIDSGLFKIQDHLR